MLKIFLLFIIALIISASPSIAGETPFTIEKGFIIIAAKIKKDVPVEVAMSTGSPYSYINMELATRHKLSLKYTNDGPVTGRNDKILFFVEVPEIIVGDQKPVSLNMRQRPVEAMSKTIGREICAILGADYFKGKIVQIDFKKKVIRFLEKSPLDYKAAKLSAASADTKTLIFKMDQPYTTFDGRPVTLPVVPDISFNGTEVRTLFDTLVAYPVSISADAIKKYGFGTVPDKGTSKTAQLKSVSLSGYEIPDVPAVLVGKAAGFDEDLDDYGAIIGLGVMQNFTITFDWKEKKVVLDR